MFVLTTMGYKTSELLCLFQTELYNVSCYSFANYQVSILTAWSVGNGACSNRELEKIA